MIKEGNHCEKHLSMTLGECPWLKQWYKNAKEIKIPISAFDPKTISFLIDIVSPNEV